MTVVRNEMERNETNAVRILIQRTMAAAYNWHSYGKDTIGARSDVEQVDIGRLQAFYRLYYQPDNAVLVVAGSFDPDKVLSLVSKYFGPIPRPTRVLPRLYTEEPVQDGERQVTLRRVGNTQWLSDLYHTVPAAHPDSVAIEAAVGVMTVSPGGRLYQALVETKKAASVDDFVYNGHDPGFAMFLVKVPDQDPIEGARDVMLRTIEGVKAQPITAAELDRVRAKTIKQIDDSINDPQRLGIALSQSIAEGDWRLFFLRRDRWRTVTPADLDRVATQYFKSANRTVGAFIPDAKPDRSPVPPTVDVAAMVKDYKGDPAVAAGETFDATPANLDARAQRFALANGMKVALLPKKTRGETVQFALRVHYGDEKSIFGLGGEGNLTGDMLMRGTTRHSRQEIEDTLDRLRAKLSVGGSQTSASARGQTVRANLAPTLDQAIKQIQAPGVDALKSFHQRFYGGAAAEIAIVGDFDAPTVKSQLERLFGDWKSPSAFTRVPEPLSAKRANAMPIETPDKANAFLTGSTSFALNDRDPDYPAFLLANYLLGGSTNSRLWNRVRQKEGLSYGIGSSFRASSFEPNGSLSVSAIFAPQNLQPLRTAVQEELKRASTEGFSAAEVEDGKRAMLQERKLARTQDAGLADALTQQAYLGRTFAYSGEVDAAIAKLTPEAVNAALRKYMQPDAFAFVFAGDFAKTRR